MKRAVTAPFSIDLDVQKALALKNDGKTVDIIENQFNYSQTQIDTAINDYAQIYASTYGVNIDIVKMAILNKYGSTYTNEDNINSNIYLDKILNQNALSSANTLGHEVAHVRQNQGETYLRDTTQLQEEYANIFGNYSASGLDFSSYVYNNVQLNSNPILNKIVVTNQDLNTLKANTSLYLQDASKLNSGEGRIDDRQLSIEEKALLFTQNANDLKEALAQNSSNLSLENINYLYELTQNAMIDEYGQKKLDEVLKKAENQNIKDEVLFVINEIKQQIQEDAKNNYYVDLQTGKLVRMMDVNNYEDTQYQPSSLGEQNTNVFNSAALTTAGLVPSPIVSGVAWGVDTVRNISNETHDDTFSAAQNTYIPALLGLPTNKVIYQKLGAGLSYYNLVQSINTFNTNAKILEIQRDSANSDEIVNISNDLPSYENNNIKDIKIFNRNNIIKPRPIWTIENSGLNLNLIKVGDIKYESK